MTDHDQNKEASYLNSWGVNNSHGRAMPESLSVGGFKQAEDTFRFSKDFIAN